MRVNPFENTYFVFLALVFAGLGFWGANYYVKHETQFSRPIYSTAEILRTRALTHRLQQAEYQNAHLESQITELNLRAAAVYDEVAYEQSQKLARLIGLVQQEGPGLELVVKDSTKPLLLGDNPNTGIVHNTDLVQVVNELRAGGATAVAINNQPIMTLTGISCSGPIITINGTRVTSPFTVQALGNADRMKAVLDKPDSFIRELRKFGIEVTVTPKHVVIPASAREMAQIQ